jgi:hypothetical protein
MNGRGWAAPLRDERGDALVYGALAVFAGVTAGFSEINSHRIWATFAAPGYASGALLALVGYLVVRRGSDRLRYRLRLAVLGLVAVTVLVVPMVVLVVLRSDGEPHTALGEVSVVEAAANRLVHTGNPYAGPAELAAAIARNSARAYCPYLPGMALFGLPRAVGGASAFTDARLVFALVGAVLLGVAFMVHRWRRRPSVRGLQLLAVTPLLALPIATGGDDVPVLALLVLGFVLAERRAVTLAGLSIGLAAAMKLTAWPVLVVVALALFVSLGRRTVARFLGSAALVVAALVVPFAVADPGRLIEHVVRYPFGLTPVRTPAASPLLGYWIERAGPYGHVTAVALVGVVGLGFAGYLLWRPPRTIPAAALMVSIGLSLAFVLAPSTRFGYFVYPAVFCAWWWLARSPEPASVDAELDALLRDGAAREPDRRPVLAR